MPLLVMVFVMTKQILLNVIMMVEIVAKILIWLVIASVMMKQTILSVTMMVGTVVDLLFPVSILFYLEIFEINQMTPFFYNANIILKKVTPTAAQRP